MEYTVEYLEYPIRLVKTSYNFDMCSHPYIIPLLGSFLPYKDWDKWDGPLRQVSKLNLTLGFHLHLLKGKQKVEK